jgi:hypothetical protein
MRRVHPAAAPCAALLFGTFAPPAFGQAQNPDLSTGGLAPPPAVESQKAADQPQPATGDTEKELAAAEQKDSGRGLEFVWIQGEVGVGHFGLLAFNGESLVEREDVETKQTGLVVGAGAGVRLVFLTVGARFRYAPLPDYTLWTLGAEGGLHMPLGSFEPSFTLGLGYVSVKPKDGAFDARGLDARLGAALDYYFTNMFSVGANLTGDMLFLSRPKVAGAPADSVYAADSSSVGGGVTLTAVMGLHF